MSRRKSVVWLILLLAAALQGPQKSARAQIFSGTSRLRMMGRATDGANYFAIMGHIKYPQTYLLPTSGPSLVDFIRFSGGALPTTNGQILIVRGERIVQQTMLTANSTIKLMPGDLVIIDGGRSGRGTIFRATEDRPQRGASDDTSRPLQIALIGVKPYPIIMQMTPDVATKRWIVRQLGQDVSVADSVRDLQRRRMSGPSGLDTRLSDNSVLIFPEGTIDTSRLPVLPRPFRAGVDRQPDQQAQTKRAPRQPPGGAAAPIPVPQIAKSDQESSPRTASPSGQSQLSGTPESDSDVPVESTPARSQLTHPGSVALDERQLALPGRAFVSDSGSASPGSTVRKRPVPARPGSPQDSGEAGSETEFSERAGRHTLPQEAARPFVSQPDRALTAVRPEFTDQPTPAPHETASTPLPLTPVTPRQSTDSSADDVSASAQAESQTALTPGLPADLPSESSVPGVELIAPPHDLPPHESPVHQTPAGISAGAQQPAPALQEAAPQTESEPAQRLTDPASSLPVSMRLPDQAVAERTPDSSRAEAANPGQRPVTDIASTHAEVAARPRSQIVPREDPPSRWPLIASGVIGSLGFLAAFSLLLSLTGPGPETPAPVPASERYWLDRIIKDDLPVQDEPALEPTISHLFVEPSDARTQRLDTIHRQIPQPHFPDRHPQAGAGQPDAPLPDMPVPDANQPGSQDETSPGNLRPQQPAVPTRDPGVPLAPAAKSGTAMVHPVEGSATSLTAYPPKRRIVRSDPGHSPVQPEETDSTQDSGVTVRPARSVVDGADLLDRVLASVNSSQHDNPIVAATVQKELS